LEVMARDRRIPASLAITSKRYDSPLGATVFLVVASLLTLAVDVWWKGLFALPATPHYFALFAWGSSRWRSITPTRGCGPTWSARDGPSRRWRTRR